MKYTDTCSIDAGGWDREWGPPAPLSELTYDKTRWAEAYKPFHKTALLFLTESCNLKCAHCFNDVHMTKRSSAMTLDYISQLVDSNPQIHKYDLMGGEPLLLKNINDIIACLECKGKQVGVYTNGHLLHRLSLSHRTLRLNVSFHSLYSSDPSRKPLSRVASQITSVMEHYPTKLVLLLDKYNSDILLDAAEFVERQFPNNRKLTVGAIRDESRYWNDDAAHVLPFSTYVEVVQRFVNQYRGRLDIDIFTKGVLWTPSLPQGCHDQVNRFKCIYPDGRYTTCLYLVAGDRMEQLAQEEIVPFLSPTNCERTGRKHCLAEKIRLTNKQLALAP